jgi:predicted amidohydrolase
MRAYLSRFFSRAPLDNVAQFHSDVAEASRAGCDLAVFPEQFITAYRETADADWLRREFRTASEQHPALLVCAGTITSEGRNMQFWYCAGREVAGYAKVHLFRPNGEHELWAPGTEYVALRHGPWRIGLGTCNDVRFPEQMHQLSRGGKLSLLVYPALWPWQRDDVWSALLRARALEHGAFCLGCCLAGVDNGHERWDTAGNYAFDPLGRRIAPQGRVYELDPAALDSVTVDTPAQFRAVDGVVEADSAAPAV